MRTPPLSASPQAPSPVASRPQTSIRDRDLGISFSGGPMQQHDLAKGDSPENNAAVRDTPQPSSTGAASMSTSVDPSTIHNSHSNSAVHGQQRQSMLTLDELQRRFEETLIYQQKQNTRRSYDPESFMSGMSMLDRKPSKKARKAFRSTPATPSGLVMPPSPLRSTSHNTDSSGSSRTIRSPKQIDTSNLTAYPFPTSRRPSLDHTGKPSEGSRSTHTESTQERLKPRRTRPPVRTDASQLRPNGLSSKESFLPPGVTTLAEDPAYPSPNLYDITLALNTDPGLDGWWSNVVGILQRHYGAERASLTVPGDTTDLENVPWGQKATYSLYGYKSPSSPTPSPVTPADTKSKESVRSKTLSVKRPELVARHSFAGFGKHGGTSGSRDAERQREGRMRTKSISGSSGRPSVEQSSTPGNTSSRAKDRDSEILPCQVPLSSTPDDDDPADDGSRSPSAVVFPVARALEVEEDPLIKRAGVAKLFGRTKPAILTRDYVNEPGPSPTSVDSRKDENESEKTCDDAKSVCEKAAEQFSGMNQNTPSEPTIAEPSPESEEGGFPNHSDSASESYEEYEQTPPSPWSQSPAPSPAPRSQPEENPFFNPKIDEEAFASSPPTHDYSKTQSVQAIGIDRAKTVIHIPLLHSSSLKQTASKTLRFPVAIISLISPVIPYPSNLRLSLTYLLPHLTTSFCLAQQYSQLEKQLSGSTNQRYGHLLGLGGTFSDASSELELVAGLSGHVNYPLGEEGSLSARSGLSSPVNQSAVSRSASSTMGTPGLELGTLSRPEPYYTPGVPRYGPEVPDGYFNVKTPASTAGQQRIRQAKALNPSNAISSPPNEPKDKAATEFDELASRDPGLVPTPHAHEGFKTGSRPPLSPPGSSRQGSAASIATQLHRDVSARPFPDTIAQLMLNSVPLHLFLAKPHTGEVIWTNSKFDAFRRSQPQEQRLRDPWQNIHESERENLEKEWAKALRTGSQVTERVRVRRFNDEAAYRWFIFRANPLLSGTGELLYWIGSFLDVHEQHVAEMKAAQEREMFARDAKFKALANSIPQVVFEATEYRGLISANEQWQLYTGQSLEEAQNLGFAKHIHRDDLEKFGVLLPPQVIPESSNVPEFGHILSGTSTTLEPNPSVSRTGLSRSNSVKNLKNSRNSFHGVTEVLQDLTKKKVVTIQKDENGRDSYTTEVRFRSKGGDFRWHLVRLVKVETPDFGNGDPSWYGTCTDINDRKLLERELNSAMQKLNNEMESKTKFFSNMSHEIRTPLNGILGTIPFVLDTQLDNDQRRMLDTIQNSSTNLRELVDNILDVSKVEAGKMNIVPQWFHVRSILEDVIDTVGSRAIYKGLELNYLVEPDVPNMVLGDRFRIRQILINLMGNAVKFTSQGEIYTHCSILSDPKMGADDTEVLLNFEVIDTGKGFSARDAERLMKRFSQIESSGSQQHAGSGLGLFLSKQLVEMHGGRLTPSSKEGQGAKFSFFVRVKIDKDQDQKQEKSEQEKSEQESSKVESTTSPANTDGTTKRTTKQDSSSPMQDSFTVQSPTSSEPSSQPSIPNRSNDSSLSSTTAAPTSSTTATSPMKVEQHSSPDPPATDNNAEAEPAEKKPEAEVVKELDSYSVLVICPLDYARDAIKQHIEQVIPLDVVSSVTIVPDVEDFRDTTSSKDCPVFTHFVLCLPDASDVMEILEYVAQADSETVPTLVIIADVYQKRACSDRYKELQAEGRKIFIVPKPVKPSALAKIFDPFNKRDLSKDWNQDMAREVNNNFKTMSKVVKELIGNKGHRVLLVEDDETNRTVMLKYLEKVKLWSETAANGQECVDMVFSKVPGYYSLIICDIQMPIKNGYETCQEIRSWESRNHFPHIPIMALSANAMMDQIDDATKAGFTDYVTKPIRHNELGKMLMDMLDPSPKPTQVKR